MSQSWLDVLNFDIPLWSYIITMFRNSNSTKQSDRNCYALNQLLHGLQLIFKLIGLFATFTYCRIQLRNRHMLCKQDDIIFLFRQSGKFVVLPDLEHDEAGAVCLHGQSSLRIVPAGWRSSPRPYTSCLFLDSRHASSASTLSK